MLEVPPRFIQVQVEEHESIPDGCSMRFKLVDAPRAVRRVRYETDAPDSPDEWVVESRDAGDVPGAALGATVEDSSAGTSILVYGGDHGLRLRPASGGEAIAEPYLLLAREAVVEWGT